MSTRRTVFMKSLICDENEIKGRLYSYLPTSSHRKGGEVKKGETEKMKRVFPFQRLSP